MIGLQELRKRVVSEIWDHDEDKHDFLSLIVMLLAGVSVVLLPSYESIAFFVISMCIHAISSTPYNRRR